ncbi:MAG: DUF362 domain-containing protein [Candidatus Omnitrophica bacterium]|nr:DUF362 domain-containing protein [Candidatus Omnitrophota bacterium]
MARVSLIRCASYDPDAVYESVKRAVDLVGGIGSFVKQGMKVLLKPNLLSERPPEDAVDTHPEVVRVVARLVKIAGGEPVIGDAPGGYGKNIEAIFEKSGIRRVAKEEGIGLVKFTSSRFIEGIPITNYVFDCDRIISLPKLKTHSITVLTAGIKNMFGTVTGLYKAETHSRAPREEDLVKILAKVFSIAKPHLTVLDGIVAMDGDGPAAGDPKSMKLVMASPDAVAIDACVAKIVGLNPLDILLTKAAYEAGLGEADLARIEIAGEAIDEFISKDFRLPQTTPLKVIPRAVVNALASFIRFKPWINEDLCERCGLCGETCPVDAITVERNHCRIDYKKCVRCLCCQEVCPYRAISIRRNILTKMVWG